MWEQLTPADIQRVKQRLAAQRIATLTRHMEEIKSLDEDQAEVEKFERLVAVFAEKHLSSATALAEPTRSDEQSSAAVEASEAPTADVPRDGHAPIQVIHQPSSNFGVPLRRLVRG
jgi:hypothetical protein